MKELHCAKCGRFLGKTDSVAFVNCPRCKTWQTFRVDIDHVRNLPLNRTRVTAG